MQNKKTLLQRLLVLYITLFWSSPGGQYRTASGLTDFDRGRHRKVELGEEIAEKWNSARQPAHDLPAGRMHILETPENSG